MRRQQQQSPSLDGAPPDLSGAEHKQVEQRTAPRAAVVYETIRREGQDELRRPSAALAWSGLGLAGEPLEGEIKIDGSSTVYLISEAAATQFRKLHPKVNITVGIAGTGGGLIQFVAAPNPGSARTGVIRIAGQDYLVTESGR